MGRCCCCGCCCWGGDTTAKNGIEVGRMGGIVHELCTGTVCVNVSNRGGSMNDEDDE